MCTARWPAYNARLRRDRATSSMASATGTASTRMRMAGGSRANGSTTRSTAGASRSTRAATATRASGWTARSTDRCAPAACVCALLLTPCRPPDQACCVRGIAGHAVVRWGRSVPGRVEGWQDARAGHLHLRGGRQASSPRLAPGGESNPQPGPHSLLPTAWPHDLPCCGGSLRPSRPILDRVHLTPRPCTAPQVRGRLER